MSSTINECIAKFTHVYCRQLLQALDEKRVSNVQTFIKRTAEIERLSLVVHTRCIDGIDEAANSVNVKAVSIDFLSYCFFFS
jgi:hypothetical protein